MENSYIEVKKIEWVDKDKMLFVCTFEKHCKRKYVTVNLLMTIYHDESDCPMFNMCRMPNCIDVKSAANGIVSVRCKCFAALCEELSFNKKIREFLPHDYNNIGIVGIKEYSGILQLGLIRKQLKLK